METIEQDYFLGAVSTGSLEIVRRISTENIALVHTPTALSLACTSGHLEIVKYLHEKGNNIFCSQESAAVTACFAGHFDVAHYLYSNGVDVNQKNTYGNVGLFYASQLGHLEMVQYLCSLGADIDFCSCYGWTSLFFASQFGHLDIVKFLHSLGADINAKSSFGSTAISTAAQSGSLSVVEYLYESGADINIANDDGLTAIMLASREGRLEVADFLYSCGADLQQTDRHNNTAMKLASSHGQSVVAEYLANFIDNLDEEMEWCMVNMPKDSLLIEILRGIVNWRNKRNFLLFLYQYQYQKSINCSLAAMNEKEDCIDGAGPSYCTSTVQEHKTVLPLVEKATSHLDMLQTFVFSQLPLVVTISSYTS